MSYTLAGTNGNVNNSGGTQSTVTDSAHIDYDEGPNNSDRRHALVASGSFLLPGDVVLGGVFTARSTMPFSATAGIDLNGDGNITDYVPGTTRNVVQPGQRRRGARSWSTRGALLNSLAAISPDSSARTSSIRLDIRAQQGDRAERGDGGWS